jgi:hypothetical protein
MEIANKDNYDYNKPYTSWVTKKPLDNTKIIAEDWWLKPMLTPSMVWCQEAGSEGDYISDYKSVGRSVRIVGTELQIYNLFCKMLKEKGWQVKDDYEAKMKPKYLELYKENNNKPIIINLR